MARFAVVGHVEWVEFIRVDRLPQSGQIAHGSDSFSEPAGGGAVAAVQLARLGRESDLFTALGDDEHGARSRERLAELGVRVHAAAREQPTRRAITQIDTTGERTITTVGERIAARGEDDLPWKELEAAAGAYFTAGDADALRAARDANVLVATPRAGAVTEEAGVELDALVYSDNDDAERAAAERLDPPPRLRVATRGAGGGSWESEDGSGTWATEPLSAPVADSYGCGDSFAAALCWALGEGHGIEDAIAVAARAGATCLTGRGPYGRQLTGAGAG